MDMVKTNPKELTISFVGKRGRRIRENYMSMTIDKFLPDGSIMAVPILNGLTSESRSYTFSGSRGLLFATQFAQPAITLLEKAAFEDMQARGLKQDNATFAGHSLGEYGVLAAMAEFVPFDTMMSVVFYRGLAMQLAMERHADGSSDYSMMAVNPARVNKGNSPIPRR